MKRKKKKKDERSKTNTSVAKIKTTKFDLFKIYFVINEIHEASMESHAHKREEN